MHVAMSPGGEPASRLDGSHVVIVGGSSGIGLATARLALALGAEVTIASRNRERLAAAAAALPAAVALRTVDMTDETSVLALFADMTPIDHLCLTASAPGRSDRIDILPTGKAREHFDGRFWGTYYVAKHALARLSARGSMTFVTGALGRKPEPGRALTSAAQWAVEGLARALAVEIAPRRVNTVVAGLIDSPLWDALPAADRQRLYGFYAQKNPVGSIGATDHVAAMIMAAVTNPYVTGAALVVDGGYSAT